MEQKMAESEGFGFLVHRLYKSITCVDLSDFDTHQDTHFGALEAWLVWGYSGWIMKLSFTDSLIILAIVGIILSTIYSMVVSGKSIDFMAGFACGFALWQVNYKNHYGKWFNY